MAITDIPLLRRLATKEKLKLFEPEAIQQQFNNYRNSMDAPKTLTSVSAFDQYMKNRTVELADYATIKTKDAFAINTPDGKSILEKLDSNAADVTNFKDKFAEAFKADDIKKAQENFTKNLIAINLLIKESPEKYNSSDIASYLQMQRTTAQTAIKKQHSEELENVTKLFEENSDTLKNIKSSMGLTTPKQVENFKDSLINAVTDSQNKNLEKFTSTTEQEVNKIHQNAQRERDRIGFIATMYANNKFNKKAIDALAEANKAAAKQAGKEIPEDNVSAEYNINGNKSEVILKGITMKDIPVFESITGRKITNNNGVFSMKFPFIGPLYYNSRHQNIDYDFTNLAMAVRASGFSKITMRINYPADEKYAEELGRRQYEAAVKAGFDPNDMGDKDKKAAITIVVNGKEMKAEELFKGHEARLGAIKGVYAKESVIRTKEYNSTSPARHEEFKEFKTAVKNKLEELKQEDLNKANPVVDEKSEKDEQNLDENVSKNEF